MIRFSFVWRASKPCSPSLPQDIPSVHIAHGPHSTTTTTTGDKGLGSSTTPAPGDTNSRHHRVATLTTS
ncbi:hypothetical protein J6590_007074 [Homalodisca vitripennis]|nr:hypothetical protein J6590_007074 [Homalodisca vitripennis]